MNKKNQGFFNLSQSKIMKDKKGLALSIWILVFGTLVLSTLVLFYLNGQKNDASETLEVAVNVEDVLNDARTAEFYLEDAFIKTVIKTGGNLNDISFLETYTEEIEKLKRKPENYNPDSDGGEFAIKGLEGIQDQLISDNLVIDSNGIFLTLEISLFNEDLDDKGSLKISHKYKKTFRLHTK